jgi:uncharacterized protein with PQ loop repeat
MTLFLELLAGLCTAGCWAPQVWRTVHRQKAEDFAWAFLALYATGLALWAYDGASRRDWLLLTFNVVIGVSILVIMGVKWRSRMDKGDSCATHAHDEKIDVSSK